MSRLKGVICITGPYPEKLRHHVAIAAVLSQISQVAEFGSRNEDSLMPLANRIYAGRDFPFVRGWPFRIMCIRGPSQAPEESMQSCGVHYGANATTSSSFAGRKPG